MSNSLIENRKSFEKKLNRIETSLNEIGVDSKSLVDALNDFKEDNYDIVIPVLFFNNYLNRTGMAISKNVFKYFDHNNNNIIEKDFFYDVLISMENAIKNVRFEDENKDELPENCDDLLNSIKEYEKNINNSYSFEDFTNFIEFIYHSDRELWRLSVFLNLPEPKGVNGSRPTSALVNLTKNKKRISITNPFLMNKDFVLEKPWFFSVSLTNLFLKIVKLWNKHMTYLNCFSDIIPELINNCTLNGLDCKHLTYTRVHLTGNIGELNKTPLQFHMNFKKSPKDHCILI